MTNQNDLNLKSFTSYLEKNFKKNTKILVSISCGLDSTVLLNLLQNSKFFINKNIFFVIFDHQKRAESKYEIQEFVNYYKLPSTNLIVKKIKFKKKEVIFSRTIKATSK